jgi:glycosyltransferase involved in cell wall biosynthesis
MPAVSVITVVRNGAAHLDATIESIQRQTFQDWEYLVVDDASTDETPSIVQRRSQTDARIRMLRLDQQGGPYVGANVALAESRGRYIVRTDGDDISAPRRIARQLAFLESSPNLRACATFCQAMDDNGVALPNVFHTAPTESGALRWYLALRCPLVHSSACVEREALAEIGGYREAPLSQDYRLWCELSRRHWLGVLPERLVFFRRHERRLTVTRAEEQRGLAKEVLQDHVKALTGQRLATSEVDALFAVAFAQSYGVTDGLSALRRWDARWMADSTLTEVDRTELARLSAMRRRKFLLANARYHWSGVLRHLPALISPRPRAARLARLT